MKYLIVSLFGGGAISYAISYITEPKPSAAMSVIYTQPQSASDSLWSQIMWWLIPVALLLFVFGGAFHLFGSAYTRLKYPAHRKISVAEAKRDEGVYKAQVGTALARAQLLEAQRAKYENVTPAIQVESASTPATITLQQAISQSTERAWIIGQAAEVQPTPEGSKHAGQLLTFDYRTTHAAIIGGTGSGKTESTAMLMVAYARKYNLHPIVLDGKEGIDWRTYNGIVEWYAMSADTIMSQFNQLMVIFDMRWKWLQDNNLPTIYKASGKRPPTLFVIIEEFGSVWMMLDKSARAELAQKVDRLFRLGRATGIVLCLIDQAPEKWTPQMRGNAKFVTCYKLKGMVANAFNEYHVDRLPHVGVFSQDNVFYSAWHTAELIDIRREYSHLQWRCLAERPRTEARTPANNERSQNINEQATNTNERPLPVENATNVPNADAIEAAKNIKYPLPAMVRSSFVRTGSWEDAAQRYFATYRDADHIDWVKAMAELANDGRPYTAFKGGLSSNLFHKYSPKGKERMRLVA